MVAISILIQEHIIATTLVVVINMMITQQLTISWLWQR